MVRRVGVEHEYSVLQGSESVDFRTIVHGLDVPGRRIDPGDPDAYRTRSGVKVTCDGPEAEVATPPLEVEPGVFDEISRWVGLAGQGLVSLLRGQWKLRGVSTHISVAVDDDLAPRAAGMFARTFAPALMLLTDVRSSPGLLIRPRFGRLEFAAEFVTGDQLQAAVAMAIGGTIVCERAAASFRAKAGLPPPVKVTVSPAVDRYGWYVDRAAFDTDLYEGGRSTMLRREIVGHISAQRQLEQSWKRARPGLAALIGTSDLGVVDEIVRGDRPIPSEREPVTDPPTFDGGSMTSLHGLAMDAVETPSHRLIPVAATWDYVVVRTEGRQPGYATVPMDEYRGFRSRSEAGVHDAELAAASTTDRTLASYHDAQRISFWSDMRFGPNLAPPERTTAGSHTTLG